MSEVLMIGEHAYQLPKAPSDRREILFIDEKPENAYWDREKLIKSYKKVWFDFIPHHTKVYQSATLYDKDDILVSLNKEDSDYIKRIYEQERDRRINGVFFKNGTEITYITGTHYFVLMWCKTKRPDKKDYFDYKEFQRDFFYLIDHVNKNDKILGLFISKPKKTGITNLMWLYYLNKATLTRNINLGNMNIDQDKAAKTFRDHFLYAYNGLPPAFKPQWKNKSEVEGRITFGKQYSNSKKSRLIVNDAEDELNTMVATTPTMPHAFDVDVFSDIWFDEPPKYKTDFGEIYRSNSAGTRIQDFIVGKIWLTSYTPDDSGASFISAKTLFFDSELRTIDDKSNDRTKSNLICYHIPAYKSWWTSIDKYGRCNEKEAMAKIQAERTQLKNKPRELQALTRQYANDKREAWSVGGAGSVFNIQRLSELAYDIEEEEKSSPENPYLEGKLVWENPLWEIGLRNKRRKGEFCNVKFVPITEQEKLASEIGRLRIFYPIPNSHQNLALKNGRDEYNCLLPPKRFLYAGGVDPTSHAAGSEVIMGSKNSSHIISIPDMLTDIRYGRISTKLLVSEYYHRPELPDEAYEDIVKEIIYFGKLSIVEANIPTVATRLMEEGLGHYMLVKDKNGIITNWKRYMGLPHESEKEYQLIRRTHTNKNNELLETLVRLIKNYIEKPPEGEKDYGQTIKSLRLLNQLMDFDAEDTRKSDLVMSFGYTLLCLETYLELLLQETEEYTSPNNIAAVLSALSM